MCGLVSVISKEKSGLSYEDKTIFNQLLFANTLRGSDATGIFKVNNNGNCYSIKESTFAPGLMNSEEFKTFCEGISLRGQILVGHNRKATMGGKIDQNAHPFIEDHICLVHNGTLLSHKELANTEIDSHAICKSLVNNDDIKDTLERINGAFALIWYNAKEKSLYFCRNIERPLALIETKNKIYLASEEKMLDWIIDRNIKEFYKIQNVPPFKIFKFNLDTLKLETIGTFKIFKENLIHKNNNISNSNYKSKNTNIPTHSIGDIIAFTPLITEIKGMMRIVEGLSWHDENDAVISYIPNMDIKEFEDLTGNDLLCGKITQIKYNTKNNIYTYIVKEVHKDMEVVSKNNIKTTINTFEDYKNCCSMCGEFWEQSDTLEESKKRIENTQIALNNYSEITSIICNHCINTWNQYGTYC
jgi:predicted glutamine amidotransferase